MLAGDPIENEWFDKILPLAEKKQYDEIIKITLSYWNNVPEPKLEQNFSYHLIYELFYLFLKLKRFEEAKIWLEQFEGFNYKKADRYDGGEFEIAKGNYLWETNKPEEAILSWGLADKKTKGQCFRSVQAQLAKSIYKKTGKKCESPSNKKPKITKKEIKKICELGSEHMEKNAFTEAESCFTKALELLPDPASDHEFYHWIMASLGDACLSQNKLKESENHLLEATKGMVDNPYVWLQLGRTYRLQSKTKKATDSLMRAYMIEGEEIFEDSQDDFDFLKSKVKL
jgi:tetratricopeptide (TPR) repeat protein